MKKSLVCHAAMQHINGTQGDTMPDPTQPYPPLMDETTNFHSTPPSSSSSSEPGTWKYAKPSVGLPLGASNRSCDDCCAAAIITATPSATNSAATILCTRAIRSSTTTTTREGIEGWLRRRAMNNKQQQEKKRDDKWLAKDGLSNWQRLRT
jgi:hypothetical protein